MVRPEWPPKQRPGEGAKAPVPGMMVVRVRFRAVAATAVCAAQFRGDSVDGVILVDLKGSVVAVLLFNQVDVGVGVAAVGQGWGRS